MGIEWRDDMESAPRDQTVVLLYIPDDVDLGVDGMVVAFWGGENDPDFDPDHWWFTWEGASSPTLYRPTHWALIEPPKEKVG